MNGTSEIAPEIERLLRRLCTAAQRRARKNFPEDPPLELETVRDLWLRQKGRCAVSGLTFSDLRFEEAFVKHPFRPSLDRIDARRGYLEGNVRLVCTAVNFGLGQWGDSVLRRIALAMSKPPTTEEGAAIWEAQMRRRLEQLECDLEQLDGADRIAVKRRIAAVKRSLTLGPDGHSRAAKKAAKNKRRARLRAASRTSRANPMTEP